MSTSTPIHPTVVRREGQTTRHKGVSIPPVQRKRLARNRLDDQRWRLNNLYYVRNEQGKLVQFRMNHAQEKFYSEMTHRNIILKARQLGFTTFIQIFKLDCALFVPGTKCMLIAHKREDASTILDSKVKVPYANLPSELRAMVSIVSSNTTEIKFSNGSSIQTTTSGRSGTVQILHVSELGFTARHRPDVADEIMNGSLPAVHPGSYIFIESTADGASGPFHALCMSTLNAQRAGAKRSSMDFTFHFFPWFEDKRYTLPEHEVDGMVLRDNLKKYFEDLRKELDIQLTLGQMLWYQSKDDLLQEKTKQEYPSTPEEAFAASGEGYYFQRQMGAVRGEGRILRLPEPGARLIVPYFDIGVNDPTAAWLIAQDGPWYNIYGYYEETDEGMDWNIQQVKKICGERNWRMAQKWFGPHDMKQRSKGQALSLRDECLGYGADFVVVPRISDKYLSIQLARDILPRCRFHEDGPNMELGISRLDQYRKEWSKILRTWKDKPLHDEASDGADAFQCFAMAVAGANKKAGRRARHTPQDNISLPNSLRGEPTRDPDIGQQRSDSNTLKVYTL